MLRLILCLVVLSAVLVSRGNAGAAPVSLVFNIDQCFGNGVVVQDDAVAVRRMVQALRPLEARYRVYALLNPMARDRIRLDRVLDALVAAKMPFMFDVCSSDCMTLGSATAQCNPYDASHGLSLSVDDLRAYKKRYGKWLAGMRFMEVLAQDFCVRAVRTTNPEWNRTSWKLPKDAFFQPETVEQYLRFARDSGMFVQWSDWHWFEFAKWDEPQKEHEAKLHDIFRRFPGIVTVTYANNEPNSDSIKRLPDWEKCIAGFKADKIAGLGLSDQSWLGDDMACPVEDIISWARSALDKGCRLIQFEPTWYFFRLPRGTFGVEDYTKDPAWTDRGSATPNLLALQKALLSPKPDTIIVVPKSTYPCVTLAAQELQYYLKKAAGIDASIVSEDKAPAASATVFYLGATEAAHRAGIDATELPRDAYHIRVAGDVVYLVGGDGDGDPLHKSLKTPVGTLFAVYDILDNDFGIRWLWPTKSGEFVPDLTPALSHKERGRLGIRPRDETVLPRFRFCGIRTNRPEEILWLRRMRIHSGDGVYFGHAFGQWGTKYGAEHPDWFEQDSQGNRHPGGSMCVSNPGLHKQIVDLWWEAEGPKTSALRQAQDARLLPVARTMVNICENDQNGNCCCPQCLALDGPEAPQPRPAYYSGVHNVSRRYAQFAMDVLKLARQRDPDADVSMYSYLNYVFAPTPVRLDPHVYAGFVADVFFPRTVENHAWVLKQWQGWYRSGASVFLRPNYLLGGYCMPENWARQFADEWQFCERRGMVGTDFDSLNGQYSTMGPVLYTVARLHAKPRMPIDDVLREYYAGFGPAAKQIEAYWEYWERYTRDHRDVLAEGSAHWTTYPKDAYKRFPPECFTPADKLLVQAERAALGDADSAAKVAFLRCGLDHARLCVETSIAMTKVGSDEAKRKALIDNLTWFRQTLKDPMAVNVSHNFFSCIERERASGWPE